MIWFFEQAQNLSQLTKNFGIFDTKYFTKLSGLYGFKVRDLGSEIRDPEKTYPGSGCMGQKRTGSNLQLQRLFDQKLHIQ
jgi:hypothetical protein